MRCPLSDAPDLRVDVKSDRSEYRPGEEAEVRFAIKSHDGRPAPGALGIVVLDKALEERAATERGLDQPAGLLGAFRNEERVAGVAFRELLAFDTRQPVPADLDLVAEVALVQRLYLARRRHRSQAFDRNTGTAFRPRFEAQLGPVGQALRQSFDVEGGGPKDLEAVTAALAQGAIVVGSMRDPWDRPYRITLGPRGRQVLAEILSDGPDASPHTGDDLVALRVEWAYFAPRGRVIDRAAGEYYERAGEPIRDLDTLRAELAMLGEDLDAWRDPWGHAFTFEFSIAGPFAVITSQSPGPDGVPEAEHTGDDVTLSTVRTEYFARDKRRIQEALDALFAESAEFPQTREQWAKVVARAGLEPAALRDPWGHPLDIVFRSESEYANRVTIRSYGGAAGERRKRTEEVPVTRAIEVVSLRSIGPDGEANTRDDFELASFRRTVAERESAVKAPKSGDDVILAAGTGAIVGTVTDSSGAPIPGARVTTKDEATSREWAVTTDGEGRYVLKGLLPGFYLVTATMAGFKSALVTWVPVESGQKTRLDISLALGDLTESVSVAAETSGLLSMVAASSGAVVEKAAHAERPLPPIATPRVRQDFPETLYWQPALETDALGNASVRLKLADTITTWKMAVVASTAGGQVATAEREILAFQPFFVENDPPPILTAGDAIGLPALVRNYTGEALRASVTAQAGDGLRIAGVARQEVRVAPSDAGRATFDVLAERAAKRAKVTLTATSAKASDAVEKSVTVHPDGAETELAHGLLVDRDETLDLVIPDHAIAGSIEAELRIAPHLATHVLDSVEAVMRRPYGCAEQTISSAYPSLLALRLIADGKGDKSLEARARRYLALGYQRLLGHQGAAGGFAYFHEREADLALTAYALRFLADAREFLDVDDEALDRAQAFLLSKQAEDGRWPGYWWSGRVEDERLSLSLTALVARTLARLPEPASKATVAGKERPALRGALDRAFAYLEARIAERDDPYALASLSLAAHGAQASAVEHRALARLRELRHDETGGSYWAHEVNTPFCGWGRAGRIEITALAIKALAEAAEAQDRSVVDRGVLFLLRNRDRYGIWWSGQATVNVLDALVTLIGSGPSDSAASDTLDVIVNGRKTETMALPADAGDTGPLRIDLTPVVGPGRNRIELRRPHAGGRLSAQAVVTYYVPWAEAKLRTSDSLRLDVRFDRKEAHRGDTIAVYVEAERVGFQGYGMLLAEIGLPPGVDVDRESLDRAVTSSGFSFCSYEVRPDRVVAYLWPRAGGMAFDFVMHPRLSMKAQSAPSRLFDYYNPEASVTLAPSTFAVGE